MMFPCRQKVIGILLLIVISGSLFSACQFAYKDAKIKSVQSIYTIASRIFATYTPVFHLNYFALAARKSIKDYSQSKTRCHFQLSDRY